MSICNCRLRLKHVSVFNKNCIILNGVSFEVGHGEILALVGKNGSGKTTILKTILNRVRYTGEILFFNSIGNVITNPRIGYVPQKLVFEKNTPVTVLEFFASSMCKFPIWLGIRRNLKTKILNILKKFEISHLINRRLCDLSGGEMQRVLLAFALEPSPDILILDEPSSALDKKGVDFFYSFLFKMRTEHLIPTILVSHDISQISKYATKFFYLSKV